MEGRNRGKKEVRKARREEGRKEERRERRKDGRNVGMKVEMQERRSEKGKKESYDTNSKIEPNCSFCRIVRPHRLKIPKFRVSSPANCIVFN